jgi:hypothetical protein
MTQKFMSLRSRAQQYEWHAYEELKMIKRYEVNDNLFIIIYIYIIRVKCTGEVCYKLIYN